MNLLPPSEEGRTRRHGGVECVTHLFDPGIKLFRCENMWLWLRGHLLAPDVIKGPEPTRKVLGMFRSATTTMPTIFSLTASSSKVGLSLKI